MSRDLGLGMFEHARFARVPGISLDAQEVPNGLRIIAIIGTGDRLGESVFHWQTIVSKDEIIVAKGDHRLMERLIAGPVDALRGVVEQAEQRGYERGAQDGRKAAIDELRANSALLRELKV